MAEWWEAAPLAQAPITDFSAQSKPKADANWWEAAPLAQQASPSGSVQRAPDQPGQTRVTVTPQQPDRGALDAAARGAASGVTANFYDELRGLVEAGGAKEQDPASLLGLIQGIYKRATGAEGAEERYKTATERERALTKTAEERHPIASLAGNVAGAVALPIGAAANAATLPGRVAAGAGVGAGFGAVSGAGEGEGYADRATKAAIGAGVGGLVGGAAPVAISGIQAAGRGIARAAEPLTNSVRGFRDPEAEAARRVTSSIARDYRAGDPGMTGAEFRAAQAGGQPAVVMDLGGETTRALARSAANTSPEGRSILNRAIDDRFEGQGPRLTNWLSETFHYPNVGAQQDAIEQVARTVNRPNYERAMQDGARGVWNPELQRLAGAPAIQAAARSASPGLANRGISEGFRAPRQNPLVVDRETGRVTLRETASGNQVVPDLRFWDQVKRNLDSEIGKANRAGDNPKVSELTGLKNSLVAQLDQAVPSYQVARSGAAHFFQAENALEAGQNFVTQNFAARETRQALARMSPSERQLFQDGFVSRLIETIDKTGDRRNVVGQIFNSPAAREKLQIAVGPQRTNELEAFLRVEGMMDRARGAVQGNSTTARQLVESGLAGGVGYGVTTGDWNPQSLFTAAFIGGLARGAASKANQRVDQRVSRQVAEMLTSADPRVLQRGMRIVAGQPRMLEALRRADDALARVGGEQSGSVPVLQAAGVGRADNEPAVPGPRP